MIRQMFNPKPQDMPRAFLTTTRNGKDVFRINLNIDEILARLEEGKTRISIDIPARAGSIRMQSGTTNGKKWTALSYYAWAMNKNEVKPEVTV